MATSIKQWICANDLMNILPISYIEALRIIKAVRNQMIKEGKPVIKSKTLLAPRLRVLHYLEIEEKK